MYGTRADATIQRHRPYLKFIKEMSRDSKLTALEPAASCRCRWRIAQVSNQVKSHSQIASLRHKCVLRRLRTFSNASSSQESFQTNLYVLNIYQKLFH